MFSNNEDKTSGQLETSFSFANPSSKSLQNGTSASNSPVEIDPEKEKALIRKIDLYVIPFIVALYLFSFLDRGLYVQWRRSNRITVLTFFFFFRCQ